LLAPCLGHHRLVGAQTLFQLVGGELIPIHGSNIRSGRDRFKRIVDYRQEFFSTGAGVTQERPGDATASPVVTVPVK
jgi:hypothetical protein